MTSRTEGIIGGVLVLLVIGAAIIAITSFPKNEISAQADNVSSRATSNSAANRPAARAQLASFDAVDETPLCQCYNGGYDLAGSGVDVLSAQYRTGYEQCRALADETGAEAFTAGWNARLSANSHSASCRVYKADNNL